MRGSKGRDTKQASISMGTILQLHLPLWPCTQQWPHSARGRSEASWVNPSPSQPSLPDSSAFPGPDFCRAGAGPARTC